MLGILDFFAKIQDWIQYYRNIGSNTAAGLPQEKNAAWDTFKNLTHFMKALIYVEWCQHAENAQ